MVEPTPDVLRAFTHSLLEEIGISDHPDPADTPDWWLKLRMIEQLDCKYLEAEQLLPQYKSDYWNYGGPAPTPVTDPMPAAEAKIEEAQPNEKPHQPQPAQTLRFSFSDYLRPPAQP